MAKKKAKRPVWISVLKWSAIAIGAREVWLALGPRRQNRRDVFNSAQFRAKETGKKLIVIGDPDGGFINRFIGRDYDCGELCIDAQGCLSCTNYTRGMLEDVLPKLGTDSAVIYVSAVLEYVTDMDLVVKHLDRVSGGDLFVVAVEPWTLTSMVYPGAQRQVFEAPPRDAGLRWKPLPWAKKKAAKTEYLPGEQNWSSVYPTTRIGPP